MTRYEEEFYNNIRIIARSLKEIAEELKGIHQEMKEARKQELDKEYANKVGL